jgi:hypothetical protein
MFGGGSSAGVREECRRVKRVLEVEEEAREMTVWNSWWNGVMPVPPDI